VLLQGEDRPQLCRKVRRESQLPVIMLTARGEESISHCREEMGADDYLAKPSTARIAGRINAVLRSQAVAQVSSANGATALAFLGWQKAISGCELRNPAGARVAMNSANSTSANLWGEARPVLSATACSISHPGPQRRLLSKQHAM